MHLSLSNRQFSAFLFASLLLSAGCRKKPDPTLPVIEKETSVSLRFDNVAGNVPLTLNDTWYTTEFGDSLKLEVFAYFISNIRLTDVNDKVFSEPESYHLIDHSIDSSKSFTIKNVPAGKYKSITFIIGVDSTCNVSGAQTGALDPQSGMFWDWNTGYIMAKLEGVSPQSTKFANAVKLHLGGFSGPNSVLRTITLDLPGMDVIAGKTPNIHLKADMLEWFKTPNLVKLSETAIFMNTGSDPKRVADNYTDMFSVTHVD